MATYLVTGAAGFIGARVTEMLLAEGHNVVGIDNINDYYDVSLKEKRRSRLLENADRDASCLKHHNHSHALRAIVQENFKFLEIDIEDSDRLAALFAEFAFDAVLNLAARAGVRASIQEPEKYFRTNSLGALNLLQLVKKHDVPRFVMASTSSLYAGASMPFNEQADVTKPLSPYAASKLSAESLAHAWHHLYGVNVCVLRYFTVYGPVGRPDMSPFRFTECIRRGLPLELYGDGNQTRDLTYIDDIARGTLLALQVHGYEVVNLGGGGDPISILEMIGTLEEHLQKKASIHHLPSHPGDMRDTSADIAKARSLLGWAPLISSKEGLGKLAAWHLENAAWLNGIKI